MARRSRILLILLLTVALLPWGAWIKAANALQHDPVPTVVAVETAAPRAPVQIKAATPHCRIATLPGPACAGDPALLPAVLPAAETATARALRDAALPGRGLYTPAGPDKPPRLA